MVLRPKNENVLNSAMEICHVFDWSIHTFYHYVTMGLPVVKIRGQWRGHQQVIEDWYKGMVSGEPPGMSRDKCFP